jgi:hypothetical protein
VINRILEKPFFEMSANELELSKQIIAQAMTIMRLEFQNMFLRAANSAQKMAIESLNMKVAALQTYANAQVNGFKISQN